MFQREQDSETGSRGRNRCDKENGRCGDLFAEIRLNKKSIIIFIE
jgi:hypothetical protein